MKLQIMDDDTVVFDNSSFEHVQMCAREGEYALFDGRIPAEDKQALVFGAALHMAQRVRYYLHGNQPCSVETQGRQLMALEKFWESHPTPLGDHRTLGLAQKVIQKYNEHYTHEDFDLLRRADKPELGFIVEEPFIMPLGTAGKWKVMWSGRIDLPVADHNSDIWVSDHKHTSMAGEFVMNEFFMSGQFMGYSRAFRERFKKKVKGALVNLMVVRKPAKTERGRKPPIEFLRRYIEFTEDRVEEWAYCTLRTIKDFMQYYEEKFFPLITKNCYRKYGECPYYKVCTLSPSSRHATLMGPEFKDDTWTPFAQDDICFDYALKLKPDEITYQVRDAAPVEDIGGPSISDLLNIG